MSIMEHGGGYIRGALYDPGCVGDHALGDIKDRHHDIKCVGENKDSAGGFEYPLEENPVVQIVQIVLFNNELDQLIGGNKGQNQTGNRQYHRFGKLPYEGKDPGVPRRRGRPYLYRNFSDSGIDRIKKPCEVAHDPLNQKLF